MTYEEINEMMMEMNLPYAYHHFAEGESPDPPFICFPYVQREEPGLQGWKEQTTPSDFDKF